MVPQCGRNEAVMLPYVSRTNVATGRQDVAEKYRVNKYRNNELYNKDIKGQSHLELNTGRNNETYTERNNQANT